MPDKLRYVIIDDEPIDRMAIENYAAGFSFLHKIAVCSHPLEAYELISNFQPDVVFADIEMPDMSGIDLIKNLSGQIIAPVFITSHPEFAIEGYEIAAFDYLVKPITAERFSKCVYRLRDFFQLRNKAFAFEQESDTNYISIKQGYDKYKLPLQEIVYLEAMKDYSKIVTSTAQYLVLSTLSNMHSQLPPGKFTRIHRSYIVNNDKINSVKGNKIYISSYELPVGKLYKNQVDGIF